VSATTPGGAPRHLIGEIRDIMCDIDPDDLTREEVLAMVAVLRTARQRLHPEPARILHLVPRIQNSRNRKVPQRV
jgi:hypothetical protein